MAPFNLYNSNMFDCYSHHAHLLIGAIFQQEYAFKLGESENGAKKVIDDFLKMLLYRCIRGLKVSNDFGKRSFTNEMAPLNVHYPILLLYVYHKQNVTFGDILLNMETFQTD